MIGKEKFQFYVGQAIDWLIHFLPNFISAILIFVVGWWIIGKVDTSIKKAMAKKNYEVSLSSFLRTLFSLGSKTILVIMVAGQVGFQTTSLAAMIGAVGLAIGLALQGSLANLAGGVLILLFKPYKVGDDITVNGYSGKVKEIQIFNTVLVLEDNTAAFLPNGSISNGPIVNHSKQSFLIGKIKFVLPLESDHESALAEIKNLFQQDNRIFKNPDIKISIQRFTTMQVHYCAYLKCSPTDLDEVIEEAKIQLLKFYQMNGYSL
jgi:small conductance mechanosensitive channel